ncbi:hypothetical protein [Brunnivagina elsteri]|uniref:hypothetical protein n=1 Tax=Brunnivagina elsteri TaxID=1247191 RepID=UPI001B80CFEE|nr:hypothetical protein [Calothrix elsteri]
MLHSLNNGGFGGQIQNSPRDFPPKCMDFEPLNPITLHLFALKMVKTHIWQRL